MCFSLVAWVIGVRIFQGKGVHGLNLSGDNSFGTETRVGEALACSCLALNSDYSEESIILPAKVVDGFNMQKIISQTPKP